jgi:hypothetical protein
MPLDLPRNSKMTNKLTLEEAAEVLLNFPEETWSNWSEYKSSETWGARNGGLFGRLNIHQEGLFKSKTIIGEIRLSTYCGELYDGTGVELAPFVRKILNKKDSYYEEQAKKELLKCLPAERVNRVMGDSQ